MAEHQRDEAAIRHMILLCQMRRSSISSRCTTDEGEASVVGPFLVQIASPVSAVLADGLYDSDPTSRTVLDHHPDATFVIPIRINGGVERLR